jgi:hypothetical protein
VEEHEQRAEELEKQADELEEQGDRVEESVDEARSDFEAKLGDSQAPGLLEHEAAMPGGTGGDNDSGDDGEESG